MLVHLKILLLLGPLLAGSLKSHALPEVLKDDYVVALPTLSELSKLSREKQNVFWLGMRQLMIELNEAEAVGVDYEQVRFSFFDSAYASAPSSCVYAGFLMQRAGGRLCPRPPACASGVANQIQCNPFLFGENVCVAASRSATQSCEASARNSSDIANFRRRNSALWDRYRADVQTYCRKGQQAGPCRLIRNRLDEIRATVGDPSTVPLQPLAERTLPRATSPRALASGGVVEPVAGAGSDGGCYSEILVQGVRSSGSTTSTLFDPEVVHRAFCRADKAYLSQKKAEMLSHIDSQITQSERARARASALYEKKRLEGQLTRLKSGKNILRRCIGIIERGGRLPSARSGSLDFVDGMVLFRGSNGRAGALDTLNLASSLPLLPKWGLGPRFCDYSLVTRSSAAGGSITAPGSPSSRPSAQ